MLADYIVHCDESWAVGTFVNATVTSNDQTRVGNYRWRTQPARRHGDPHFCPPVHLPISSYNRLSKCSAIRSQEYHLLYIPPRKERDIRRLDSIH